MAKTEEIHEIIITGNPKRLQDAEKEYSASLKRMEQSDKRLTDSTKANNRLQIIEANAKQKSLTEVEKRITQTLSSELDARKQVQKSELQKELLDYRNAASEKIRIQRQLDADMRKTQILGSRTQQKADLFSQQQDLAKYSLSGGILPSIGGITTQVASLNAYRKTLAPMSQEAGIVTQRINELNGTLGRHSTSLRQVGGDLLKTTAGYIGLSIGLQQVAQFYKESFKEGARFEQISSIIKVTAADMEKFKIAAGGMVDDTAMLQMIQYGRNLEKTDTDIQNAILQARTLSKVTGDDLKTSYDRIVKGSDGYLKTISSLNLSKTKFNEILKEEVKSLGGVTEMEEMENGQKELNIKNLSAEQQLKVRTSAFNKLFAESYGDISNAQLDTIEKTKAMGTAWDEFKEGFGKGMLNIIDDLTKFAGMTGDSAERFVQFQEAAKNFGESIFTIFTFGPATQLFIWAEHVKSDLQDIVGEWLGLKQTMEAGIAARVNLPVTGAGGAHKYIELGDIIPKGSSGRSGSTPRAETEKEILSLIDQEQKKLIDLNKELQVNIGIIGAELEIRNKIREVDERIFFLRTGMKQGIDFTGIQPKNLTDIINSGVIPHIGARGNFEENFGALEGKYRLEEEANKQDIEAFNMMKNYSQEMLGFFGGMDATTQKILDTFFNILEGILSGGKSGGIFGMLAGTLLSFIPGGGFLGGLFGGGGPGPGPRPGGLAGGLGGGDNFIHSPMMGGMKPVVLHFHSKFDKFDAINISKALSDATGVANIKVFTNE